MGQGLLLRGGTSSILYTNGDGNTKGSLYTNNYGSIIQQGNLSLKVATSTPNSPSSGELTFFSKNRAGRIIPSVVGPSGVDFSLQGALFGSSIYRWMPGVTTGASIAWSTSWSARNSSGAQSHPAKTSTNALTSLNRALFSTTAIANTSSGIQSTNTVAWIGDASNLGGFFFFSRFGMSAIGSLTGVRVLLGLSSLNGNLTSDPSTTSLNTIAIIKDAADTTWQLLTRNTAGGVTKINTLVTVVINQVLDIYIHTKPNGTDVSFQLRDGVSGADLYIQTITTNLPTNTTFLYASLM